MLKKIVFFLTIFFLFSERIVFSYWSFGLPEPIELAYAFTERETLTWLGKLSLMQCSTIL